MNLKAISCNCLVRRENSKPDKVIKNLKMPKKYYKQKKKKKKKNEDKHKPLSVPTKSGFILLLVGINDFPQIQPKLR